MSKRVKKATELFKKGLPYGEKNLMSPRERDQFRKNMRDIINSGPEWD